MMGDKTSGGARPRLLFTGGGGAGSEALARLLAPRYEVFFADADLAAKPFPIADSQWLQIPLATAPEFAGEIAALCRRLKVDLFIPTVDEELLPIARLPKPLGFEVLLPPEHFVARHLDKLVSNQFLRLASLPAPATMAADQGRIGFPCIVKPRSGRGSRNVAIVNSEAELQAQITLARQAPEDFVVQELVTGQEFTVMVAADRAGELRAIVPVLVERKRGITLRAATLHDRGVIEACRAIHAADPVPGCYNVQLIKAADGSAKPFEINPRISTTACLGLAAGVDFAGIFLGRSGATGPLVEGLASFTDHLGLKRSWHNEIVEPAGA
ncbi:MAG: ATP-grasp domain-containing protein [Sulfuritalea sp.]|nr:ATP-grasp domain-containing protein [Sulfuritalea sp.]